jgi:hypothetical protein
MSSIDNSAEQMSQLTQKRLALESLIRITCSVQTQQQCLLELSVIARPSQEFPKKLIRHIETLKKGIGNLSASEIIQRLDVIEKVMAKDMQRIVQLVDINVNELRDEQLEAISIDEFVDAIANFHRRTQTAVALRYLLIEKGVAIAPFTLSIPQESILAHIENLKVKEKGCVQQIRGEIISIISDSELVLGSDNLSPEMTIEISKVRQAMKVNLEHLDSGGKIKDIPNVFETIVLESPIVEAIDISEPESEVEEQQQTDAPEQRQVDLPSDSLHLESQSKGTLTFFQKLKLWLSSPWSVSWKNIEHRNNTKNQTKTNK